MNLAALHMASHWRVPRGAFCGFAFALLFAAGCSKSEKEAEPVVTVQTATVQRGSISQVISSEAVVYPLRQAVITPKITSTISEFRVQRGSRVRKGDLLAVLENRDLSAAAVQSKGEFEQAEASYATTIGASLPQQLQKAELDTAAAKAAYEAQKKVSDSRKELFQQGALPRRDLDAAEVALAQARSQYEVAQKQLDDLKRLGEQQTIKSAKGQLDAAQGKYRGAEAQLRYSQIRSPIDGVVADRPLFPGELATANQPILTVMDTSRLIAKAHIAQSEAALLKAGDSAEVMVAGTEDPVKARVTLVSPAVDPGSTTIEVWVEAVKPDPALKPGATVQLSIVARTVRDALIVPASAVLKNSDGVDYVMVAGSDGRAHAHTVQVGIRQGNSAQILNGLNPGDAVITVGAYALPDNTKIKVEAPASPQSETPESNQPKKSSAAGKDTKKDKD